MQEARRVNLKRVKKAVLRKIKKAVHELAGNIRSYSAGEDKTKILELASAVSEKSFYGIRQKYKDLLFKESGYHIPKKEIRSGIETICNSILFFKGLGIDDKKIARRYSVALALKSSNMQKRVDYLMALGVNKIKNTIERLPSIIALNPAGMQERVDYLIRLGVRQEKIGRIIERIPSIVELKTSYMQKRVDYLGHLGVRKIGRTIEKYPNILSMKMENMQKKVNCLKKFTFNNADIVCAIEECPSFLALSIGTIEAKCNYFIKNSEHGIEALKKFPTSFNYSLKRRIIPRVEYAKLANPHGGNSLANMLTHGDEIFAVERACSTYKDYQKFKKDYSRANDTQ